MEFLLGVFFLTTFFTLLVESGGIWLFLLGVVVGPWLGISCYERQKIACATRYLSAKVHIKHFKRAKNQRLSEDEKELRERVAGARQLQAEEDYRNALAANATLAVILGLAGLFLPWFGLIFLVGFKLAGARASAPVQAKAKAKKSRAKAKVGPVQPHQALRADKRSEMKRIKNRRRRGVATPSELLWLQQQTV